MATLTINTEQEYEVAIKRIEELWGALPFTEGYKELNELVSAAEAWEMVHYPIEGVGLG